MQDSHARGATVKSAIVNSIKKRLDQALETTKKQKYDEVEEQILDELEFKHHDV